MALRAVVKLVLVTSCPTAVTTVPVATAVVIQIVATFVTFPVWMLALTNTLGASLLL